MTTATFHGFASDSMVAKLGGDENAEKRAQDLRFKVVDGDTTVYAVVDGARNFLGPEGYVVPEIATHRGLKPDTVLNGGEIAATVVELYFRDHPKVMGKELVQGLNEALAAMYTRLGMKVDLNNRGELFTVYFAAVHVTPEDIFVTAVGDCYVIIDGELVAGVEKKVDTFFSEKVREFAEVMGISRQEAYELLMPTLNAFQFRLQNSRNKTHKHAYAAVDGTETLEEGIQTYRVSREVKTLVLHTDGFKPFSEERPVTGRTDLKAVNRTYSEAAAIVVEF